MGGGQFHDFLQIAAKIEVQFLCFLPQFSGFSFEFRFGSGDQPQPKLGFPSLFATSADFILEILF
jgi:hypothetical protein